MTKSSINDVNEEANSPLLGNKNGRKDSQPFSKTEFGLAYFAFVLIGMVPQMTENALFSETAVFQGYLHEGPNTYTYFLAAFMLGHIISFIYLVVKSYFQLP